MVITDDASGGQEKVTSGPAELDVDTTLKDKSQMAAANLKRLGSSPRKAKLQSYGADNRENIEPLENNRTRKNSRGLCPSYNENNIARRPSSDKMCEERFDAKLQRISPASVESNTATLVATALDLSPVSPSGAPALLRTGCSSSGAATAAGRRQVAPLWSRARLLAATRADPVYRRSDIEDAVGAVEPEPWWAPPPIDERRRRQLFEALRDAAEGRSPSAECAAEQAVRAVLYRKHPELRVQRVCQPPDGQCGDIDAEGFIHRGTMPVRVYDDLFLAPANLSRQEIVSMIRAGQYQRGHNVACFYAYLYSYEFVFFCEYLRRIECHTPQAMAVVRGVLQRAEHMHLISHSATIFSLAPEAMFTQRSPFLYLARLFPMQEQWEADLLCDMVNCHDLVKAATAAWKRGEHALFTIHQDMRQQARDRGGLEPPFHPAVVQRPSSAAAFSNIEGEQVQRLDSHGLVVFQESGASFSDVGACCRFSPLGELSAEEVLRRSVGRHALIRLYDDVFFLGAPPVDLYRKQIRYLRPAEVRLHVQVGFYFDSPGYADFLWRAQRRLARSLADGCRTHAPQLSSAESELVRWLLHEFANTSRRALHDSVRDLARFGPYLLNEYGKTLWRVLGEYLVDKGTLQLCTGLTEHARATLEAALAEHGCLQDN